VYERQSLFPPRVEREAPSELSEPLGQRAKKEHPRALKAGELPSRVLMVRNFASKLR
jgi:hypothetical protein